MASCEMRRCLHGLPSAFFILWSYSAIGAQCKKIEKNRLLFILALFLLSRRIPEASRLHGCRHSRVTRTQEQPSSSPLLAEIELDLLPGCALACGADNLKWHAVFVIDDEPPCPKPKMDEIEFWLFYMARIKVGGLPFRFWFILSLWYDPANPSKSTNNTIW